MKNCRISSRWELKLSINKGSYVDTEIVEFHPVGN